MNAGKRMIGDHGELRTTLTVGPKGIDIGVWDLSGKGNLQVVRPRTYYNIFDFEVAKKEAVVLIAQQLGYHTSEFDLIRQKTVWYGPY